MIIASSIIQTIFWLIGSLRVTFDKDAKGALEDICTVQGFIRSLQLVLRVVKDGLLHAGQPCNSFSWMSSATHARGEENMFMGRDGSEWIKICNLFDGGI